MADDASVGLGEGSTAPEGPPALATTPVDNEVVCGPLLNYRRMDGRRWYGSVLIVTRGGGKTQSFVPTLILTRSAGLGSEQFAAKHTSPNGEANKQPEGACSSSASEAAHATEIPGTCLYSDPRSTFWAFDLIVDITDTQTRWEYEIPGMDFLSKTKPRRNGFFVPSITESFRILFYSCNGFSDGIDEESWSGPALWSDVLRRHAEQPWSVMIGGGDQIYNDGVGIDGPLRPWTDIQDPEERRKHGFPEQLRQACDDYYRENYIRWYSTEPFASANGAIPQLSIWDDHDIIDGYGSYADDFMKCDVFVGIGNVAYKYYMLFQHHLPPPSWPRNDPSRPVSVTSDAPSLLGDLIQPGDVFVGPRKTEPSYILGPKPGPYISACSHSIFARLGARIAFLGIDARTERTLHQINYPETYDKIFLRTRSELESARRSRQPYKHLILLLGIPVAYPRLTLLEDICKSSLLAPLKFLNRKFGTCGTLFNHFDGSVDLLDDMEDHYTARTHKKERNALIEKLQELAADYSVRVTILGGDVHLAALGRFYSNPDLHVSAEKDHRYMVNVISSAITNEPPPRPVADYLAWRNVVHHLNPQTEEAMLGLFNKDPGDSKKTAGYNNVTMPSRNFAAITENSPNHDAPAASTATLPGGSKAEWGDGPTASQLATKDGTSFMHAGEVAAGTEHKAASDKHGSGNDGGLDICFFVEIDHRDRQGRTERYGLTVPALEYGSLPTLAPEPEPSSLVVPTPAAAPSRKPRSRRRLTKALLLPGPFRRHL